MPLMPLMPLMPPALCSGPAALARRTEAASAVVAAAFAFVAAGSAGAPASGARVSAGDGSMGAPARQVVRRGFALRPCPPPHPHSGECGFQFVNHNSNVYLAPGASVATPQA